MRFYIDPLEQVSVDDIANQLASTVADGVKYKVRSYRRIGFGAEGSDGSVVSWHGSERKH